jgi:hypothetical protein
MTGRTLLRVEAGPLRQHVTETDLCGGCADQWVCWLRQSEVDNAMRDRGPTRDRLEPAVPGQ